MALLSLAHVIREGNSITLFSLCFLPALQPIRDDLPHHDGHGNTGLARDGLQFFPVALDVRPFAAAQIATRRNAWEVGRLVTEASNPERESQLQTTYSPKIPTIFVWRVPFSTLRLMVGPSYRESSRATCGIRTLPKATLTNAKGKGRTRRSGLLEFFPPESFVEVHFAQRPAMNGVGRREAHASHSQDIPAAKQQSRATIESRDRGPAP